MVYFSPHNLFSQARSQMLFDKNYQDVTHAVSKPAAPIASSYCIIHMSIDQPLYSHIVFLRVFFFAGIHQTAIGEVTVSQA